MLKKSLLALFACSILIVTFLSAYSDRTPPQKVLKTIIIDAGHGIRSNGGYDGAKGSYSYEDEICYDISKELVAQLKKEYPDINIIETRPTKQITALHERANIANHNNGDLFISIHVNAAPPRQHKEFKGYKTVTTGKGKKKKTKKVPQYHYYTTPNPAKGTETYIWGSHKNEDKEVAVRENAPMMAEENFEQNYGGVDVNSPEFIALSLLKTKQFFKRSASLASFVEDEFEKVGRTSRGQKQRQVGIWVLQATAMPSVLVETGYITNKEEEDYLNSKEGQVEIATCVKNAVANYISWIEKNQHSNAEASGSSKPKPTAGDAKRFLEMIDEKEKTAHTR